MTIHLISFTPLSAGGGVPRWNRDFCDLFPGTKHWSFRDFLDAGGSNGGPEWEKALVLNSWLLGSGKIGPDDIVIVDGFWGRGLERHKNVVSVAHGIWSHLLKEEADAGVRPDFPAHHAVQVEYRTKHLARGGRIVAVSDFIRYQMKVQFGFESSVINNAIDLEKFRPNGWRHGLGKPLVIHGVNDRSNPVKGWDHIEECKGSIDAHFMSLDEATHKLAMGAAAKKYDVLAMADVVLIPSAYEGNSYFALESLACGVPVVAYDVGLFWEMSADNPGYDIVGDYSPGMLLSRKRRSKEETVDGLRSFLGLMGEPEVYKRLLVSPRMIAERYSMRRFRDEWSEYLEKEFDYDRRD